MRLLLVEDDVQMGPALQNALSNAGYAVDLSVDGIDAEALGDIEPYDLIVLDLGLPKRSGMEVLQNWRSRNNHVPVVILTARGSWEEKVHGFKAGADDYVAKPFQTEELLARISAVLKRSSGTSGGPLQVAGLLLDEDAQSVTLSNGSLFTLTGTEFRLLRYFMLHPGQVISKSRLTEHVYEYDSDKDSNVIEVYVNRLRHKVGTDLIQTRRGQGYIFGSA
ncbi:MULTISPECIES: response regulator transcription factor [unclassified Methylophaga]|jgi:DNA-binding response OmpR family regulator|uniref:response regulator transcription factor n=1 Tax=unclassified Methylophaga TaxID=2629249 RepID=UPI000C8CDF7B|nr:MULTISPECIES: response regulator transcription factor [unclassified Methylophaga]MAK66087.1 DNA-binding response regulator [Methylophaga sp.]MAK68262.1 DNA-binding response regulator [Methylophaga sp.]MAY17283.1 DNA-binding response regulator [Methylophaga sp.]MBN45713.1 DNA-binding response regulator [Methylophaga sp.]HAO24625.1 DNA-binding response regulator [Methylophaga sp.]|tara:strand:+ start:41713 stop:42375 length:663 start_codon:yes stop_codon:yes gene_type:complete